MTSKGVGRPLVLRDELGEHALLAEKDRRGRVIAEAGAVAVAGLLSGQNPPVRMRESYIGYIEETHGDRGRCLGAIIVAL